MLKKLYNSKKYIDIINFYNESIENGEEISTSDSYYIGLVLFKLGYIERSIPLLKMANDQKNEKRALSLGLGLFAIGQKNQAKKYLLEFKNDTNIQLWLEVLDLYNNMEIVKVKDLIFHFEKGIKEERRVLFINNQCKIYAYIQSKFNSRFRKKIDIYVYDGWLDYIGNRLNYTNQELTSIFTSLETEGGHELAHLISYYKNSGTLKKRFIDEGISVFFDSEDYKFNINKIIKNIEEIDILDFWIHFEKYNRDLAYEVAGLFIFKLFSFDEQKFYMFIKDQTYKHAIEIYGDELSNLIKETENEFIELMEGIK